MPVKVKKVKNNMLLKEGSATSKGKEEALNKFASFT